MDEEKNWITNLLNISSDEINDQEQNQILDYGIKLKKEYKKKNFKIKKLCFQPNKTFKIKKKTLIRLSTNLKNLKTTNIRLNNKKN